MLARALLEGVGVCARSCGSRFARSGRLLRPVLLPLLERLGDGCPAVAAAAQDALACLCANSNYADLQVQSLVFALFQLCNVMQEQLSGHVIAARVCGMFMCSWMMDSLQRSLHHSKSFYLMPYAHFCGCTKCHHCHVQMAPLSITARA